MATGETVTVGCKLPHGIHMDIITDTGKKRVTLRGNNSSNVIGGFGINPGVSKEFFDKWMSENQNLKAVKDGLIWAYKSEEGARKKALEEAEKRHGMEKIDPKKLPVKGIKTANPDKADA